MPSEDLAGATMRLAADDIYAAVARDFSAESQDEMVSLAQPDDLGHAREELDELLTAHAEGDAQEGADLAFRLAVVDAAFRPNPAVNGQRDASRVRQHLVDLIKPALQDPESSSDAATVVRIFEQAHKTGTRLQIESKIAGLVKPEALLFLVTECSVRGQTEIVDGSPVTALALFDYQETTLGLEQLHGLTDPLNWPDCNSAFKSVEPVDGSYWETSDAYGIDVVEDFGVPHLNFRTLNVLSITYVDRPKQKAMIFDLSTANAHLGDGQVVVDRGFSRAVDLGDKRRFEGLKVVHFGDNPKANATAWFACLWWDLLSVRTATLCPNSTVTPPDELARIVGVPRNEPHEADEESARVPGPIESLANAWGDLILDMTRETGGIVTRTATRWPPGEQVTGGKLTSDLIEGFERLTPSVGKGIDLSLRATQQAMDRVAPRAESNDSSGSEGRKTP